MPEIKLQTEDLITFSEAARLLNVTRMTIYAWIERGKLHPLNIARNKFLLKDEIEKLRNEKLSSSES
jgi:excisionase family DNA binding protein